MIDNGARKLVCLTGQVSRIMEFQPARQIKLNTFFKLYYGSLSTRYKRLVLTLV